LNITEARDYLAQAKKLAQELDNVYKKITDFNHSHNAPNYIPSSIENTLALISRICNNHADADALIKEELLARPAAAAEVLIAYNSPENIRVTAAECLISLDSEIGAKYLWKYIEHNQIYTYSDYYNSTSSIRIINERIKEKVWETYGAYWLKKYKRAPRKLFILVTAFQKYISDESYEEIIPRIVNMKNIYDLRLLKQYTDIPKEQKALIESMILLLDIKRG
jgi:uncharacterized protein YeeX (DUF496 family)